MIDYIVTSAPQSLLDFTVAEAGSNFSCHFPVMVTFRYNFHTEKNWMTLGL